MSVQIRNSIWGITNLENLPVKPIEQIPKTVLVKPHKNIIKTRPKAFTIQLDEYLFLDYQVTTESETVSLVEKNKFKKQIIEKAKPKSLRIVKPTLKFQSDLTLIDTTLNGLQFGGIIDNQPDRHLKADFYLDTSNQAWYKKDELWHIVKNES